MKRLYQLSLLAGLAISVTGAVIWAKAGFPISFGDLFLGGKTWRFNKDSGFFLIVLGLLLAGYCAFEMHLKRWERPR